MKRNVHLLVALCLVLALLPRLAPTAADTDMIMVAFDYEYVRDTTPDTMPFLSGGILYIYYADFARLSAIDTAHYNARLQQVRLFDINRQLTFDLANSQTYDEKGEKYEGIAMWRDGRIFLPARTVRDKFDLYYSYVSSASPTPVAILYSQSAALKADTVFLDETEFFRINTIFANYQAYLESLNPTQGSENPGQTTTNPVQPTNPTVQPEPRLIYLTFEGEMNEVTVDILAALSASGAKAAFFLPPDSIAQTGELIRRAYTDGHTIGLLLDEMEEPVEALAAANELLKAVLFTKTRLVRLAAGADAVPDDVRDALVAGGYRLWDATIVPEGDGEEETDVQTITQNARNSLNRSTATSVMGLYHTQNAVQLIPEILRYIRNNNFSLLVMKEWDTPVNRAGDVR